MHSSADVGACRIGGLDTAAAADTAELWKIRQQVGMVFQNPDNQLIAAVVEDDVAFGPENLAWRPMRSARACIRRSRPSI